MAVYINRSQAIAERLVKLRDYLYANASPTHAVKIKDILAYLASEGHEVEIKTVYKDLETLKNFFKLELHYDGRQKGYILKNPPFELYELRLIINSIQAAKFITQQEADKLTEKMAGHVGEYIRPSLKRHIAVHNRVRAINEEAMKGLDTIYEAIAEDKKIRYKYFYYTTNKNRPKYYTKENGRRTITASPYKVTWNGEFFSILVIRTVNGEETKDILQLEHMEQIEVLPDAREGKALIHKRSKYGEIRKNRKAAFSRTKLKVYKGFISFVVDKYGNDILIMPLDDKFVTVVVNEYASPDMYIWAMNFHPRIEITFPLEAEEKIRKYFLELSEGNQPFLPTFFK